MAGPGCQGVAHRRRSASQRAGAAQPYVMRGDPDDQEQADGFGAADGNAVKDAAFRRHQEICEPDKVVNAAILARA